MKKVFASVILALLFGSQVQAQTFTDIFDNMEGYRREREAGNEELAITYLLEAKKIIDKIGEEPDKLALSKYWKKRGDVYFTLGNESSPRVLLEKEGAPQIAIDSYLKALTVEKKPNGQPKIEEKDDLLISLQNTGAIFDRLGAENYNNKNYPKSREAYEYARKAFMAILEQKPSDKNMPFYINNAFGGILLSAYQMADYQAVIDAEADILKDMDTNNVDLLINAYLKTENQQKALEVLGKLKEKYPNNAQVYISEIQLVMSIGDYEKIGKLLEDAYAKFPNRKMDFILAEFNFQLEKGDNEKALEALQVAIANTSDPEMLKQFIRNASLLYAKVSEKAESDKDITKAIQLREKANEEGKKYLEMVPDDEQMAYQLGYNEMMIGNMLDNQASEMEDGTEKDNLKAKSKEYFTKAIPYILAFYESTKDEIARKQLVFMYNMTGQRDKANSLKVE